MEIIGSPERMRALSRELRAKGERLGFVPTMGALHEGHLSLIHRARRATSRVVVSIFVNPAQFGPQEDFRSYPSNPERDAERARLAGADVLYNPAARDVYPPGYRTYVAVEGLGTTLEGASRPGHFRGVATVVAKLLGRVAPHVLFLGQKDAQQAVLLRKMIRDLEMDVEIEVCPTVREDDGLAMSSRNAYLTPAERRRAPAIYAGLRAGVAAVERGERSSAAIAALVRARLVRARLQPEYVAVVDLTDLLPHDRLPPAVLIAVAARLGRARLIDNVIVRSGRVRRGAVRARA